MEKFLSLHFAECMVFNNFVFGEKDFMNLVLKIKLGMTWLDLEKLSM